MKEDINLSIYWLKLNLLCNLDKRIPNIPKIIVVTIIDPIKVEYLARGPKVSIAWDSNSPGVNENNVCDASSGRNNPPANNLIRIDIAIDTNPATSPAEKENKTELCLCDTLFIIE